MIELGIVKAIQKMDRSGPRSREADTNLAGEFGVRGRHKSSFLLMPNLHELKAV
jgi:hypothetical protein